ncbi:uncharacterized protein [Centruroides vittatus]|uniref:uncharacterized protein n=1 Tax=Centruroides vittatus TaxID=120091 RepID=UPI00350EAD49
MKRLIRGSYCNPYGGIFLDEEKKIYTASCPCPAGHTCMLGGRYNDKVYRCRWNKFIKTTTEQPEVIEEIVTTEEPEVEEILTTETSEEIINEENPEDIEKQEESNQ